MQQNHNKIHCCKNHFDIYRFQKERNTYSNYQCRPDRLCWHQHNIHPYKYYIWQHPSKLHSYLNIRCIMNSLNPRNNLLNLEHILCKLQFRLRQEYRKYMQLKDIHYRYQIYMYQLKQWCIHPRRYNIQACRLDINMVLSIFHNFLSHIFCIFHHSLHNNFFNLIFIFLIICQLGKEN